MPPVLPSAGRRERRLLAFTLFGATCLALPMLAYPIAGWDTSQATPLPDQDTLFAADTGGEPAHLLAWRVSSVATPEAAVAPPNLQAAVVSPGLLEVRSQPLDANNAGPILLDDGDTLGSVLADRGIDTDDTQAALSAIAKAFDIRRLREGQSIAVETRPNTSGGEGLVSLSFDVDARHSLLLQRTDAGFRAHLEDRPLERRVAVATGRINGSFYRSAAESGLPAAAMPAIVKLFSWDVDFQRDIQPGDKFAAVYEHLTDEEGNPAGLGAVRYAALEVNGRLLRAYRFERGDGSSDYLDENGRPLRKWLLRTPVDGARLSSTFGSRRHPILGYTRMHKGVDFAAPSGTPIYAAGSGKVEMVGRNRGYGNYVRIRHNAEYATAYGHMSRFARGLKRGDTVKQGQIIGYVGATGLATGPHLHYEVLVDGSQINPLSVKTIEQAQLSGSDLQRFRQQKTEIDRQVEHSQHMQVAQNAP